MSKSNNKDRLITVITRRQFVKATGMLTAGMIMTPNLYATNNDTTVAMNQMSVPSNIVPLFILDCCTRLGRGSDFINAELKHCITSDSKKMVPGNTFYMGPAVPFGKNDLIDSLDEIKRKGGKRSFDYNLSQRLAVVSGALAYQAGRENLKMEGTPNGFSERKVYEDATVLRTYFGKGKRISEEDVEQIQNLFKEMVSRIFIRFHTLMPDDYGWPDNVEMTLENGAEWVNNMEVWRKQTDTYFESLAKGIANPDSQKVKQYIEQPNFFSKTDPLLVKLSTHAKIAGIHREEASDLIKLDENSSSCTQAIAAGYKTLIGVNDFIAGKIDKMRLLEIIQEGY